MTKTGNWIGKCCMCGQTYRAAKGEARGFCACRAASGQPQTAINWKPVKARVSAKACDASCTNARSDACACQCEGNNHGIAWARGLVTGGSTPHPGTGTAANDPSASRRSTPSAQRPDGGAS